MMTDSPGLRPRRWLSTCSGSSGGAKPQRAATMTIYETTCVEWNDDWWTAEDASTAKAAAVYHAEEGWENEEIPDSQRTPVTVLVRDSSGDVTAWLVSWDRERARGQAEPTGVPASGETVELGALRTVGGAVGFSELRDPDVAKALERSLKGTP